MSQLFIRSSLNDVARGRYCATDLQFSSEKWELSMSSSLMVLFCRRPDITYATLLEERLLRGEYCQKIRKSQIDIIALNDRSTTREVRFQVSVQLKAPL